MGETLEQRKLQIIREIMNQWTWRDVAKCLEEEAKTLREELDLTWHKKDSGK